MESENFKAFSGALRYLFIIFRYHFPADISITENKVLELIADFYLHYQQLMFIFFMINKEYYKNIGKLFDEVDEKS